MNQLKRKKEIKLNIIYLDYMMILIDMRKILQNNNNKKHNGMKRF